MAKDTNENGVAHRTAVNNKNDDTQLITPITDKEITTVTSKSSTPHFSRNEAERLGKSLRAKTPRSGHRKWQPSQARRNPVDILQEVTAGLQANLLPIRFGRMLQSPFTFFRGSAAIMAADLATTPNTGIYVQACGDCHLLNFGIFATPERALIFDINDFDETLPAPWEWDVKRLVTSFVIASSNNNFSKADVKATAMACAEAYRTRMAEFSKMAPLSVWYSHISEEDVYTLVKDEKALARLQKRIEKEKERSEDAMDFPKLTSIKYGKAYIKDNPPLIYHRTDIDQKELYDAAEAAFQQYFKTLGDEKKILLEQYKFQDIATKIVGIGSVGTRCSVSLRMSANNDPLFLQAKEARASVLEPYAGKSIYANPAQRVVMGQKLMQAASDIFIGWSEEVQGAHFYVRQLRDVKIKPLVDVFDPQLMNDYARLCGWALARAHARSGKASVISGYLGSGNKFDTAIAQFAIGYAEQNDKDFATFKEAVKNNRLDVFIEES